MQVHTWRVSTPIAQTSIITENTCLPKVFLPPSYTFIGFARITLSDLICIHRHL